MGPLQGERALLGGPDYGFRKILANGAGQKKKQKTKMTHAVLICKQTMMLYS